MTFKTLWNCHFYSFVVKIRRCDHWQVRSG